MMVLTVVSRRVGQVTFDVSCRTSRMNLATFQLAIRPLPSLSQTAIPTELVRSAGCLFLPCSHRLPAGVFSAPGKGLTSREAWQEWRDSNPQPPVLETGALPIELHSYESPLLQNVQGAELAAPLFGPVTGPYGSRLRLSLVLLTARSRRRRRRRRCVRLRGWRSAGPRPWRWGRSARPPWRRCRPA